MHELHLSAQDKAARYREVLPQIAAVIADETDLTANLANTAAVLKEAFGWLWVGFYLAEPSGGELVLAPFQGPLACTRIPYGRGVCGHAWAGEKTIVVPNVDEYPGHIACSSLSRSEIVIPLFSGGRCVGVLDIDDIEYARFDNTDALYLEQLAQMLGVLFAAQKNV